MSASRTDARRALAVVVTALAVAPLSGCRTAAPTEGFPLFEQVTADEPRPPSDVDRAVADLLAAALAGTVEQREDALARIEVLHDARAMKEARLTGQPEMRGLVPLCIDLDNATLDDPQEYRRASKELLRSFSLHPDPALKARLEQAIADDPLALASKRTLDHWEGLFARTFNAVVEPIGKSLVWGVAVAPFNLATSLASYTAEMFSQPEISLQERQALAHRKRFVAQYPHSVDAPAIERKIEVGQAELDEMLSEELEDDAKASVERGSYRMGELQAARALDLAPGDERAAQLLADAQRGRKRVQDLRAASEQFSAELPEGGAAEKEMLELLLVSTTSYPELDPFSDARGEEPERVSLALARLENLSSHARMLLADAPNGPFADEAEYVLSLAQHDLGFGEPSWDRLRALGRRDPRDSNMARHAQALLSDPWENTYGNYLRQRHRASDKAAMRRVFGRFADGSPNPSLPEPVAWLISIPALAQTVAMTPMRMVFGEWNTAADVEQVAAVAAYRHLGRRPYDPESREVARWLYGYEIDRENWSAALGLVDLQGDVDDTERLVLMEKAAERRLEAAELARRRDFKSAMLRSIAQTYPDTDAGYRAGEELRALIDEASPQRIRMTRSFLLENPEISGARGLGVSPTLLDDELSNGEVHPEGVTFLGGQVMEFALVAESGDEDDPPYKRRERISPERLARAVAMLDETVTRNEQLDDGDAAHPDAFRDQYFERARLGLAEEPDLRAAAESDYVYESLREQYGVVRGRDSLLPFDLVFQGSLGSMTLGAFPRWRQPRETPDAFLYR